MDFSAIIGIIVCFGMIAFGILNLGGDIMNFLNLPSVAITIIPTLAALFIAFPIKQLAQLPKHVGIIMGKQKYDPMYYIETIHSLAEKARANGLVALEHEESSLKDPFFVAALRLLVDATDTDKIQERLWGTLESINERHAQAWEIYDKGAAFAPAFGMVGTLISLVNMLMDLDFEEAGGVASLGINMSMALITTFYGSLMANVFFIPLGNKLKACHQKEILCKELIIEGVIAIQKGYNPRYIQDMLTERVSLKLDKS